LIKVAVMIVVAGTVKVPQEKLAALTPHINTYVAACRAEDGCIEFSFANDMSSPGLVRVFEIWRDEDALERHKSATHVAVWRALWPDYGVHGRNLSKFKIAGRETF
jgi:quinol monooxygenase YgiN